MDRSQEGKTSIILQRSLDFLNFGGYGFRINLYPNSPCMDCLHTLGNKNSYIQGGNVGQYSLHGASGI